MFISLNSEEMEEANEFTDLVSVMCKPCGIGEIRKRALQGRKVIFGDIS